MEKLLSYHRESQVSGYKKAYPFKSEKPERSIANTNYIESARQSISGQEMQLDDRSDLHLISKLFNNKNARKLSVADNLPSILRIPDAGHPFSEIDENCMDN